MQVTKTNNYQTQQNFRAQFSNKSEYKIGTITRLKLQNLAKHIKNYELAKASCDESGNAIITFSDNYILRPVTVIRGKKASDKKTFIKQITEILNCAIKTET